MSADGKICVKCRKWTCAARMTKRKGPNGLYRMHSYCLDCVTKQTRLYKAQNREKCRQKSAAYYAAHRDECRAYQAKWRAANKDAHRAMIRAWRTRNLARAQQTDKVWRQHNREHVRNVDAQWKELNQARRTAYEQQRRVAKIRGMPSWLDAIQLAQIQEFYDVAAALTTQIGVEHQVDHIHPLRGRNFRGLHVPWNLQILTASANAAKGNRLECA